MRQRKDGRYEERLYIQGVMLKPKYFYSSEKSERKAKADIERKIFEYKKTLHLTQHNFFKLCENAIEDKITYTEHNTIEMYKYAFKRIPEDFNTDIEKIDASDVQSLMNDLAKQKYSYSAIHQVKVLFGVVYDYAILNDVLLNNFIPSIKIPKSVKRQKIHSPKDEVINFVKKNVDKPFGFWALFLLCTGTRIGEANAIQKKDIDFKKNIIHITKSTEFVGNNPQIKSTKTENGKRDVPILEILKPHLKAKISLLNKNDFLFGGISPMTKTEIRYNFNKYRKECRCKFTQHQLRHAYAKVLYMAGVDAKTAQGLLGHSSITVTMDIYTDFSKTIQQNSADKINAFLN